MKNVFLILSFCIFYSCSTKNTNSYKKFDRRINKNDKQSLHKIQNIDSLNSYYIIYTLCEDINYQIVSKKTSELHCNSIKIGSEYALRLSENLMKPTAAVNKYDLENCVNFDDTTRICRARYMRGIYYANNLEGLCISSK